MILLKAYWTLVREYSHLSKDEKITLAEDVSILVLEELNSQVKVNFIFTSIFYYYLKIKIKIIIKMIK